MLSYALTGVEVSVYGSADIGRVVDVVRSVLLDDGYLEDRQKIVFVEEDREALSLSQAIQRSTEALSADANETVLLSAGDLVLGYNTYPWLLDRHVGSYDLILDLNARQVVFPPGSPRLFARNYYDSILLPGEPEVAVDIKESNALLLTAAGGRGLAFLDRLRHPPSGSYSQALLREVLKTLWRSSPAALWAGLSYILKRSRGRLQTTNGLRQRHLNELATSFFGVPTMVKADNTDPFFIKDCDNLEDLFGYYRTLLQSIVDSREKPENGYRELERYYPYSNLLWRISRRLRPLAAEIPLWRRWSDFIRDKIATHNNRLQARLRDHGIDCGELPVPEYFDGAGAFLGVPAATDDIDASKALLLDAYRARFDRDRARFRWLTAGPPSGQVCRMSRGRGDAAWQGGTR